MDGEGTAPVTAMNLGGRLPLLAPAELSMVQTALANRLHATFVPWADAAGFESTTADGRLIGPFNPVLFSPEISNSFFDLQAAEQTNTSLEASVREVVILTVGAVWECAYELYAHSAVARAAGLSEDVVRGLAAGEEPAGLTEYEALAHRFVRGLVADRMVDSKVYRDAEAVFGKRGLVDIITLSGIYGTVCGMLNTFDIPAPELRPATPATVTPIAEFPVGTFLENLIARHDDSLLVSSLRPPALWYVPPGGDTVSPPQRLHAFGQMVMGLVELEPDIFLIATTNGYTTHESALNRLDLRGWKPGDPVTIEPIVQFPKGARALNGCALISERVLVVADSAAGRLWRVDLHSDGKTSISIWLEHPDMTLHPGEMKPEQPGINGVRFAARSGYLYYTSSVAYVTTHRQNTIDRVGLVPGANAGRRVTVAGSPFDRNLLGPSSVVLSRTATGANRVAFVTSDGGTTAPPADGILRPARVLRVEFPSFA
jgi:AhpD family alkylhydroperoxidase